MKVPVATAREQVATEAFLMQVAHDVTGLTIATHPWMIRFRDDILSDATLGAATAYLSHDPGRGASVKTRVGRRVRGAVLDGIRDRAPVTRDEWRKGVRQDDLPPVRGPQVSLEVLRELDAGPAVDDAAELCADRDTVRRLLALCTDRERVILLASYGHAFTCREIADWYGVSESLINKTRARCIQRLRSATDPTAQS